MGKTIKADKIISESGAIHIVGELNAVTALERSDVWKHSVQTFDNISYTRGKVSIGTTDTKSNLQVEGNVYMSSNLEVGEANLFVDTETSKVGIGTRTPLTTLHVEGNVYASSNIGIGTSTPEYTLDVHGTANVGALTANTISGDGYLLSNISASSVRGGVGVWTVNEDKTIYYETADVAIGKTNPTTALDVVGTVTATEFSGPLSGRATTATDADNATNVYVTTQTNQVDIRRIIFGPNESTGNKSLFSDSKLNYVAGTGTLTASQFVGGGGGITIPRLNTSNVSIGSGAGVTSQNSSAVAIGNNAGNASQGSSAIAIGSGAGRTNQHDNTIILNASGTDLNSEGTTRFYVKPVRSGTVTGNALAYTGTSEVVSETSLKFYDSGNVEVGTANLFVDTQTSRVGVATRDPDATLHIEGNVYASSNLEIGQANLFVDTQTSRIGVATRDPDATLHVEGNAYVSSNLHVASNLHVEGDVSIGGIKLSDEKKYIQTTVLSQSSISNFGKKVAISGSNKVAAVSNESGEVYVYTRDDSTQVWTRYGPLTNIYSAFGVSIAIDYEGDTIAVGYSRGVTIYRRSGTSWNLDTNNDVIQISNNSETYAVDITNDGNRFIVGCWSGSRFEARIYDYTTYWSLSDTLSTTSTTLPIKVAISGDGDRVAIVIGDYSLHVFNYVSGSWSITFTQLTPQGVLDWATDVGISGDGNRIIVSSLNYFYLYKYTTSWTEEDTFSTQNRTGRIGALSDDGNALVLAVAGAAFFYLYNTASSNWELIWNLEVGSNYGWDVAISDDSNFFMVSYPGVKQVYVFENAHTLNIGDFNSITPSVSYVSSFTGQHICTPGGKMEEGLIVSANKNKYVSLNGPTTSGSRAIQSSEALPVVSLSNVVNDKSVFGVVDTIEYGGTSRFQTSGIGVVTQPKELGDNRVIVNSLGEGAMWVVNTNGNLSSGDYITTSNVVGYGQKQNDDILHSYTVAKITMDCDFNPPDIPIQEIKKDENGTNILDNYGRLQWEDTDRMEKAYQVRYLTSEGKMTDESNAVHIAAYVGCTYHCG